MKVKMAMGILTMVLAGCGVENGPDDPEYPDAPPDRVDLAGQACEPVPEFETPVKVLLLIDTSGSMQQMDYEGHRAQAARALVRANAHRPEVTFAVIGFATEAVALTPGFVHLSGDEEEVFGAEGLGGEYGFSDYTKALELAHQLLLEDLAGAEPHQRALTRVVVAFLTDGAPAPVCIACLLDPPDHPLYSPDCHPDLRLVCEANGYPVDPALIGGLEPGQEYNTDALVVALAADLAGLEQQLGLRDMDLAFYHLDCRDEFGNPTTPLCWTAATVYNVDREHIQHLLGVLANAFGGTFTILASESEIDFSGLDLSPAPKPEMTLDLLVTNDSAVPGPAGPRPDSDGDGLADEDELDLGVDPLVEDSDGDGYGDAIEARFIHFGFEPTSAHQAGWILSCEGSPDADGDGLLACEESWLETDDQLVDSDHDGLPDPDELRWGTDPERPDLADARLFGLALGPHGGAACGDFEVADQTLVATLARDGDGVPGVNDLLVWLRRSHPDLPEFPASYRVACVRVRYDAEVEALTNRLQVLLTDADFHPPQSLDRSTDGGHCVWVD